MNIAYLVVPLLVGIAIWLPTYFIQTNLSGHIISSTPDLENVIVQEAIEKESKPTCPASCDDNNSCSSDWCNETSDYSCSHTPIDGTSEECWGNPASCSTNTCVAGKCTAIQFTRCCGNAVCESNESCNSCSTDCGECPTSILPPSTQPAQTTQQSSQTTSTSSTGQTPNTTTQTNTTGQTTSNATTLNHITINEFTTRGPNGSYDEFAELYNPTNSDINITGWKLQYKSATGDTWQSKVGSGISGVIKSKSFFLLASKGYSLTTQADYLHNANWGLSDTGGHLRIIDTDSTVIDKVGWGDANDAEGSPTPALEENKSLERKSLTTDTDNNSNDFTLATPSPKNSSNQ